MAEHDQGHEPTEAREGESAQRSSLHGIWPIGFAAGIALILVGVVISWPVFWIGVGIAVVFGVGWVWDSMRVRAAGETAPTVEQEEEEEAEEPERFGRNVFLERTTLGLGALIGIVVTVPAVGFAVAPTFIGQEDDDIDIGPLSTYPEGQWFVVTFESKKGEGAVGLRTAFVRNNGFKNEVPSLTIISNRCVHLGCPIQPTGLTEVKPAIVKTASGEVALKKTQPSGFACPCHGGAYSIEGNRTAGPPVRSLDRYSYSIVHGHVVLGQRFSVGEVEGEGADAMIHSYTRFDPGQHVDGPEAWLYPASPQGI